MRFPWFKRETRADGGGYADQVERAYLEHAQTGPSTADATGALEAAAGLWARAFASAVVENAPEVIARAVTPSVLAMIGRHLVRRGESLHRIMVRGGMVELIPASHHTVEGGPDADGWMYRVHLSGPTMHRSETVSGAALVHCRYATAPEQPWHGIPPLQWAAFTAKLHGRAEAFAMRHVEMPSNIAGRIQGRASREATRQYQDKASETASAPGFHVIGRESQAPRSQGPFPYYGPDPNHALTGLHSETGLAILAACGVPPSLTQPNSDGTAQRESWRRFLFGTIGPIARTVERELADKLDAPGLRLSFDEMFASDLTGRARAVHSLTQSGVPIELALAIAGMERGHLPPPTAPDTPPTDD